MPFVPPSGDPLRFSVIAHAERTILGPLEPEALEALLDRLALPAAPRVLDVGCGKGDLLVRLAQRGATGLGVDRNPWFLADAERLAAASGAGDRVELRLADAAETELGVDWDVVACVGASGALGGPEVAPAALARLVRPGGTVLVGEGFWRLPPEEAWLASFGIAPGEMADLEGTIARVAEAGLEVVATHVATTASWDAYEDAYAAGVERWAAANPADPDRAAFLERARMFRETYHDWRRAAMGFVLVVARLSEPAGDEA